MSPSENAIRTQLTCFIEGLRRATASTPYQVTTDGFAPYKSAITTALSERADYAMFIKFYRAPSEGEGRYSPTELPLLRKFQSWDVPIRSGSAHRLSSGPISVRALAQIHETAECLQPKVGNHWAAIALWLASYNFCRVHKSLRVRPATAAGISGHVWSVRELFGGRVRKHRSSRAK